MKDIGYNWDDHYSINDEYNCCLFHNFCCSASTLVAPRGESKWEAQEPVLAYLINSGDINQETVLSCYFCLTSIYVHKCILFNALLNFEIIAYLIQLHCLWQILYPSRHLFLAELFPFTNLVLGDGESYDVVIIIAFAANKPYVLCLF